jgi:glycine cleavage system H protein
MEMHGYQMPEDLYYEKNHYWVKVEGDMLIMGMDDFAQQMAGDIVFVKIPFAGKKLEGRKKIRPGGIGQMAGQGLRAGQWRTDRRQ